MSAPKSPKPPVMGVPAEHVLTQSEFLLRFQDSDRFVQRKKPFCFILGAGASVQSGVPAAQTLIDEWLPYLHKAANSPLTIDKWATADNLGIPGFEYDRRAEKYSDLWDLRFRGHEEDGFLYLQDKMKDAQPSYGYAVLAQLTAKGHRAIITTNFDSLASDAMFLFGGEAPFICGHERLADYIPEHSTKPIVIKIHRDLQVAPINSHDGTSHLADDWHPPMTRLLQRYVPIFIGYGGNDGSLMQFLEGLPPGTPERVYWCQRKGNNVNATVAKYLSVKDRYLVPIDGFDQLMHAIHGALGLGDLIKTLETINQTRLSNLRESQAKLTETAKADVAIASDKDGADSPSALEARFNLATALFDQGRYAEAEAEHLAILAARRRTLGERHPDTLMSWHHWGRGLLGQGKADQAHTEYTHLSNLRQEVLGAEHPDTLASRNNLATALNFQAKYAEAEQEHRAVLNVRERVLGEEHPDTLGSRNNLALTLRAQTKYVEAEQEHRAVLKVRERVLGTEHRDTLISRNNLANALRPQGKYAEAEQEYKAVSKIQERVLGTKHPDTLMSRMNMANAQDDQGKHAEAEQEHRAVLKVREHVQGTEHPDTLMSRTNLAKALYSQAKYGDAEQEYRAAWKLQERVLGAEHPDVARTCYNLALCLDAQKTSSEAIEFMQRAEQAWTKALGSDHPDTKDAKAERERIEAALTTK